MLLKFKDDTKLGGIVNTLEGRACLPPWETSLGVPAAAISTFGALKGLSPQHRRKPLETSEGKRQGERAGNWNFQPFPPAFLPFEMLEQINSVHMHFNGKW